MNAFSKTVALQSDRIIVALQAIALLITLTPVSVSGQNAGGFPQDVIWLASPGSTSCAGPTDRAGRAWTDPAFDEAGWVSISLPDEHVFRDRFYRGHLQLAAPAADVSLFLNSDDGAEVFLNGSSLGAFGGGCHAFGCANRPGSCRVNQCVPPLALTDTQLGAGDNVLAVHVSNGGGGVFFNATVFRGNSGNCGNCRLEAGEQCDPTVAEGACPGFHCGSAGTPNACACPAEPR